MLNICSVKFQDAPACEPSPHICDIYIFFQRTTVFKKLAKKLRTIALPVYFMVLNFDYDIHLSIITYMILNIALCMPVTFIDRL